MRQMEALYAKSYFRILADILCTNLSCNSSNRAKPNCTGIITDIMADILHEYGLFRE